MTYHVHTERMQSCLIYLMTPLRTRSVRRPTLAVELFIHLLPAQGLASPVLGSRLSPTNRAPAS